MDSSDPLYYINQHYAALQEEARKKRLDNIRAIFEGTGVDIDAVLAQHQHSQGQGQGIGSQTLGGSPGSTERSAWKSLADMNAAIARQRQAAAKRPKPPVVNKESRIHAIEEELDIIRGIKPTPKGYRVDTSKVKALMTELKELKAT